MPSPLLVSALGAVVEITFDDAVSAQDATGFATAWEGAVAPASSRPEIHIHVTLGTTAVEFAGRFDVAAVNFGSAVAALSTKVTLAAIEYRKSQLVMLHACGVATPDGTVFAFVGPSGRGKTTLVSTLARTLAYVTDETIGIEAHGSVRPYRKPLSRVAAKGTKEQLSPQALGLLDLPERPLQIGSIALIDRRPDWEGPPRSEAVPLADALTQLVPELSYLPQLDKPLQRLAGLIGAIGGVNRIIYAEAGSIGPELLRALAETDRREPWSAVSISRGEGPVPPGSYVRVEALDGVRIGDVMVLLHGSMVRVLDGIGPAIWEATELPTTLEEISRSVEHRHGSPGGGAAIALVEAAAASLVEVGVLQRG
ncbi:hypothetical protein N1027_01345 [Herbiconiux sp. CPCC 205763]|uniref:AAA+ ATPase domain-containing protein n=1 Tax=Herbiconiux aconitum TaxID=2970913 RepID=A0ABT2GNB4_9MICO|nr:hypothetical protein [Herbiconiux aconitum]MCS5716775.1 hypothetical protein [Herbiconiux aconitum]